MLIAVENNESIVLFSIIFGRISVANEASEHRVVGVIARASIIDSRALTHDRMTNPARFPGDALTRLFNEIFSFPHFIISHTHGDSGAISLHISMPAGFRRHLVGKTVQTCLLL